MLKRYSHELLLLIVASDLAVTAGSWLAAYYIRFHVPFPRLTHGLQPVQPYLYFLPVALLAALLIYRSCHLYVPRREGRFFREVLDIFRACAALMLVVMAVMFLTRPVPNQPAIQWARPVAGLFAAVNFALLILERALVRALLRRLRRMGWNLRHVLIVGIGRQGQRVLSAIRRNPWTGFNMKGFVSLDPADVGKTVQGAPVVGAVADLGRLVADLGADQVFVALAFAEQQRLAEVLNNLSATLVNVRVFPDLRSLVTLNPSVEDFDGMPVMSLHESPLTGWNVAAKRLLDIIVSLLALIPATPVMLFFGLLHKALSRGPVFYRQTRVGLDGAPFRILKLRTMRVGADHEASASWTTPDDPRVTHLGRFMRRWNIDELPQLWNVLLGHMSLVGPRPERPELIEQFRQRVPRYMLRHKMKAGMTGWAQVNGWRGNTSLDKRIQYDLYYIENWSLLFDLWVLLLTPFARKNAY